MLASEEGSGEDVGREFLRRTAVKNWCSEGYIQLPVVGSEPVSVSEFEGELAAVVGVDSAVEGRGFARGMLDTTLSWDSGRKPLDKSELVEDGGGGCCVMVSEEHWELGEVAKVFAASRGIAGCESGSGGSRD